MVYKTKKMFKRYMVLLSILFALTSSLMAFEQEGDWQVLTYVEGEILRITSNGIGDSIVLPEGASDFGQGNTYYNVALTPDERFFIFVDETQEASGFSASLNIADLETDTCCTVIPAPDGEDWEVINLLGFDPDGRQLVINFLNAYFGEADALIAILNVETGEYVTTLDPYSAFNTNAIFFIDWNEDGIEVVPSCFPCGASADGATTFWNLETGEIIPQYGYNVSFGGSQLAKGDVIEAVQDEEFPIGNADVMAGPFNVIEYYVGDDVDSAELIYFNTDNLVLIKPEWVMDGQAYLIQEQFAEGGTLVWRDGTTEHIQFNEGQMFLTGTPDGWLMTNFAMQKLVQYQWVDGEVRVTELGEYPTIKMLNKLRLGESVTEEIVPVDSR